MKRSKADARAICALLPIAAALLLFCSQSSPLYPLNVWGDANCLLTVGRVMKAGGVVYRDIYEQKGPTLYLLHMLAACLSDTRFWGVYVMEALSLFGALAAAFHLLRRRMTAGGAVAGAAVLGALVVTSASFAKGDSAEEFCLPLILGALAVAFDEYGAKSGPMRPARLALCGLLCGLTATIKYTLLGAFIGLCACEGVLALRAGGVRRALASAGAFLMGMLTPIALWGVYFAAHGALGDAVQAYLTNNMFLYDGERLTAAQRALEMARLARDNWPWVLPAVCGVAALLLDGRERLSVRLCALAMAAGQFATVFLLGRVWAYSPLALAAFAVLGVYEAAGWCGRRLGDRTIGARGAALASAGALAFAWLATPNAYLRGVERSDLAQTRLAAHIPQGASVLQYSHLDDGLYLTTGALPVGKYFVRLNVAFDEMRAELDRYVDEALAEYVLVSWEELPARFDRYELIAADVGYDDGNRLNKMMYLYRRTGQ